MEIETIKNTELKHFEGNPRKISDEELEKLKRSLIQFSFVEPLVIDENNVVIGGNQRLLASTKLSEEGKQFTTIEDEKGNPVSIDLSLIPCYRAKGLTEARKKALNVALNKISGEFDLEKLPEFIKSIEDEDKDAVVLTGFDEDEITAMFEEPELATEPVSEDEQGDLDSNLIKCPKCGHEFSKY